MVMKKNQNKEFFIKILSRRLKKERKRVMWQSGLLRSGNPQDRKYWIEERLQEQDEKRLKNVFYKEDLCCL